MPLAIHASDTWQTSISRLDACLFLFPQGLGAGKFGAVLLVQCFGIVTAETAFADHRQRLRTRFVAGLAHAQLNTTVLLPCTITRSSR